MQRVAFTRTHDPKIIEQLLPYVVLIGGESPEKFANSLEFLLRTHPDNVLIVLARRLDNSICGFIIAENTPDCVWIIQAYSDPSNGWTVIDEMFARVMLWASILGKKHIKADTQRSVEALYRRFGFRTFSVTLIADVPDQLADVATKCVLEKM